MIYLDLLVGVFVALGVTYIMSLIYCSYIDKEERQKKINLLIEMRRLLEERDQPGFCGAFWVASKLKYDKAYDMEFEMFKKIPELKKHKPKKEDCYANCFWFVPYQYRPRVEIINKIIRELS